MKWKKMKWERNIGVKPIQMEPCQKDDEIKKVSNLKSFYLVCAGVSNSEENEVSRARLKSQCRPAKVFYHARCVDFKTITLCLMQKCISLVLGPGPKILPTPQLLKISILSDFIRSRVLDP